MHLSKQLSPRLNHPWMHQKIANIPLKSTFNRLVQRAFILLFKLFLPWLHLGHLERVNRRWLELLLIVEMVLPMLSQWYFDLLLNVFIFLTRRESANVNRPTVMLLEVQSSTFQSQEEILLNLYSNCFESVKTLFLLRNLLKWRKGSKKLIHMFALIL